MGTPVTLRDIVGEAENVLLVRVIPLHCQLYADIILHSGKVKNGGMQRCFLAVQVLNKGLNTPFIFKDIFLVSTLIGQPDPHT